MATIQFCYTFSGSGDGDCFGAFDLDHDDGVGRGIRAGAGTDRNTGSAADEIEPENISCFGFGTGWGLCERDNLATGYGSGAHYGSGSQACDGT